MEGGEGDGLASLPCDILTNQILSKIPFSCLKPLLLASKRMRCAAAVPELWPALSLENFMAMAPPGARGTCPEQFARGAEAAVRCRGVGLVSVDLRGGGPGVGDAVLRCVAEHAPGVTELLVGGGNQVTDQGLLAVLEGCAGLRSLSVMRARNAAATFAAAASGGEAPDPLMSRVTERLMLHASEHCRALERLRVVGLPHWFRNRRGEGGGGCGAADGRAPEHLGRMLRQCRRLESVVLTGTAAPLWNVVSEGASRAIREEMRLRREEGAGRGLRVEMASGEWPERMDVSCGVCGAPFYRGLGSYVHVPGSLEHITTEVITDEPPVDDSLKRGGLFPIDSHGDGQHRLRCARLCQAVRFWLIDNGTPEDLEGGIEPLYRQHWFSIPGVIEGNHIQWFWNNMAQMMYEGESQDEGSDEEGSEEGGGGGFAEYQETMEFDIEGGGGGGAE